MRIFGLEIKRAEKTKQNAEIQDVAVQERSGRNEIKIQLGEFTGLAPTFSALGNDYMENEAYSTAIRTNAIYCSKAEFSSVIIKDGGERKHDYKSLDKLLQLRPNPINSASVFWERVAIFYYHYNNAFIYMDKDAYGEITALWALDPAQIQFSKIEKTGEIILRFNLNGKEMHYPYSLIAHIAGNVTKEPLFGVQNTCISRVLNLINTNYQGIENAIITSAYIRFIGELVTKLSDDALEEKSREFSRRYLNVNKQKEPIGIAFHDSSYKLTPVATNTQKTANYAEMRQFDEVVYGLLGCPKAIIDGTATPEQKASYYERTISTFFQRVAQELTAKIYTPGEYGRNNRIVYADRKLEYYDIQTRLQIFNAVKEMGAVTFGTLFDLLGLPVAAGMRDKVVASQNYQNGNKQGGNNAPDGGDGKDGGAGKTEGSNDNNKSNKTEEGENA